MKVTGAISVLVIMVMLVGVWYQSTASECPVPLHYRLGDIDESFDITYERAKQYVLETERIWEERTKRNLFDYREDAEFTIDFVFDERQEMADAEEQQKELLDDKLNESNQIKKTVEELQGEYLSLSEAYEEKASDYERRLAAYNKKVNQYNDRGGAPEDVFNELEKERDELNEEVDSLNKTANELNEFAEEINKLSNKGNLLVNAYNQDVNAYNDRFGFEQEFTQGDYRGVNINIYKFSSSEELLNVLVHEFGHALGIGHIDDSSSVMYYLLENTDSNPVLSSQDVLAFYEICGTEETFGQKVRRIIRENLLS